MKTHKLTKVSNSLPTCCCSTSDSIYLHPAARGLTDAQLSTAFFVTNQLQQQTSKHKSAVCTTNSLSNKQNITMRYVKNVINQNKSNKAASFLVLLSALAVVCLSSQLSFADTANSQATVQAQSLDASTVAASIANDAAVASLTTSTSSSATNKLQPQAAPLIASLTASRSSDNVITIRYANVSTTQQTSDNTFLQDYFNPPVTSNLQVFKLYNEPLSVDVIVSKFSSSITLFDVSNNQLSTLSKDLFCPLSNDVRSLNISRNLLENFDCLGLISQAGQLCLSELRVLDMSFNLIKYLPATGVATLQNLEVLNLSNNLIESLDELALSSLFKLGILDLSNNRLTTLSPRTFHKSTSMQILKLAHNVINTPLSQNFLFGLTSLEQLDLSFNNISHVSENSFAEKFNLSRVDLRFNSITTLRQEALSVTSVRQASGYRHRVHHNGQYAGIAPRQSHSMAASAEFFLSGNPFVCDCNLEWLKRINAHRSTITNSATAINKRLAIETTNNNQQQIVNYNTADLAEFSNNNATSEITSVHQENSDSNAATSRLPISSLLSSLNTNLRQQQATSNNQQRQQHFAKVADFESIKCTSLFKRNTQRRMQALQTAPSDGYDSNGNYLDSAHSTQDNLIDLASAEPSNFLCRYKSHCFALCQCCEFDACDCEMMCPDNCHCYYDQKWQTNIVDCSVNNHTFVPARIPMDVSGLYLDGNNINSLKPHVFIGRRSMRALFLNSTNLQTIANRTFNGLIDLQTLHLNDNMLRVLNGYEFESLGQLKHLYLQSNRLEHINNATFINLRALEVLDLSQNRLISQTNLQLFWSIGHHNIRLRYLFIANNWWSCQCSLINQFRQILSINLSFITIVDKNQLRCYHNSTTVGPTILGSTIAGLDINSQLYSAIIDGQGKQLNELNQCSEDVDDPSLRSIFPESNPPQLIDSSVQNQQPNLYLSTMSKNLQNPNDFMTQPKLPIDIPMLPEPNVYATTNSQQFSNPSIPSYNVNDQQKANSTSSVGSYIILSLISAVIFVAVLSFLVFVNQQRRYHSHTNKKCASSSSSTASSVSTTSLRKQQLHHSMHGHLVLNQNINLSNDISNLSTLARQNHTHINQIYHPASHSANQNNIYAQLNSPTPASQINHHLYQGIGHHATSSINNFNCSDNIGHYGIGTSSAVSYKAGSLYNHTMSTSESGGSSNKVSSAIANLPKVKQFVSKIVNKSLALSGYRTSRDEISSISNDKIYDAYISYDKQDESFVMQHLSAELEYGQPQYRIADRYRDLPSPSSEYIAEAITSVISCSQRTIVVLSDAYNTNAWCRYELQAALSESTIDRTHKIIVVVVNDSALTRLDSETRALVGQALAANGQLTAASLAALQQAPPPPPPPPMPMSPSMHQQQQHQQQQQQQLVQLSNEHSLDSNSQHQHQQQHQQQQQQQLVAMLVNGKHQQVAATTSSAAANLSALIYSERQFWQKLKQLMPTPQPLSQALTLTTKS